MAALFGGQFLFTEKTLVENGEIDYATSVAISPLTGYRIIN